MEIRMVALPLPDRDGRTRLSHAMFAGHDVRLPLPVTQRQSRAQSNRFCPDPHLREVDEFAGRNRRYVKTLLVFRKMLDPQFLAWLQSALDDVPAESQIGRIRKGRALGRIAAAG